jgi:diguanylate cyclase (GGDEF)-like protein
VNDTRGHDAGDKALQLLADALRSQLRRSDEAYRIGGDEFAVVLPKSSRLDAERVMRRLRAGIASSVPAAGDRIEASFGIALFEPGDDPERVVARADDALYQAKRRRAESVA